MKLAAETIDPHQRKADSAESACFSHLASTQIR